MSWSSIEPAHLWQRVLRNQRGAVLAHALRRDTGPVVCRFRSASMTSRYACR